VVLKTAVRGADHKTEPRRRSLDLRDEAALLAHIVTLRVPPVRAHRWRR
jgi:hypothetical protein